MGSVDQLWLLVCAALVFFMQAGFTVLECGLVRAKNRGNVAIKNCADFCVSGVIYLVIGFGVMFGDSAFGLIGTAGFFSVSQEQYGFFLFQLVFCSTCITIASGAVAERLRFHSYILLVCVISVFVYPIVGHWIWAVDDAGDPVGWLAQMGFLDFGGATVVHGVGAWAALAAILVVGPRRGRFDPKRAHEFEATNFPLLGLGVFILWFGWFGFNGGSTSSFGAQTHTAILNTVIAGLAGGMVVLLYEIVFVEKASIRRILNGVLAGLVAITASCGWVSTVSAILIAAVGAFVCILGERLLERNKIDDVVGAVPIHGFAGAWGTLAVAIFSTSDRLNTGHLFLQQLGVQALGIVIVFGFTFGVSYVAVRIINSMSRLRVTAEEEQRGLDLVEHGIENHDIVPVLAQSNHGELKYGGASLDERQSIEGKSLGVNAGHSLHTRSPIAEEKGQRSIQVLFERTLVASVLTGSIVLVGIFVFGSNLLDHFATVTTRSSLKTQIELIKEFRTLYTKDVVSKLSGIVEVSHDHRNHKRTIPLPATLTKDLSKNSESATETFLYSDLPFPWRKEETELLWQDSERKEILRQLREDPTKTIVSFPEIDGKQFVRVSTADRMRASCIGCHNSHPDTPKADWKVGDVRGVLQVQMPSNSHAEIIRAEATRPGILLLLLLAFIGVFIVLVLKRFKKISIAARDSLQKVDESEKKFRSITENSNDAIITTNSNGIITFANAAALEITGYSSDELVGASVINIVPEKHKKQHSNAYALAVERQDVQLSGTVELPMLTKSGEEVPTDVSLSSFMYKGEVYFSALVRDLREKKQKDRELAAQRNQLIHNEKLASIGELAAGVGHEINNPLAVVQGNIERLRKLSESGDSSAETVTKYLDLQEKAVNRISKIVNGLRTYARTDSDTLEAVDCHDAIEETLHLIEVIFEKEGIEVKRNLNASRTMIEGNLGKLSQIFMNLISNSRDAFEGQKSPTITVSTLNEGNEIVLKVSDNGSGIEKEVQSKVFDAFFTTKAVGSGTGMGLSLCAQFIREMSGSIKVESEIGEGTTFIIRFPCSDVVKLRSAEKKEVDAPKLSGRAIVVDDEEGIREILREQLEELGLAVEEAENGEVALQMIKETKYDYLFTDIKMPKMTGDQLVAKAKEFLPAHAKIVVVTGGVSAEFDETQSKELAKQVTGLLAKPFSSEDVVKVLNSDDPFPAKLKAA